MTKKRSVFDINFELEEEEGAPTEEPQRAPETKAYNVQGLSLIHI